MVVDLFAFRDSSHYSQTASTKFLLSWEVILVTLIGEVDGSDTLSSVTSFTLPIPLDVVVTCP